MKESDSQFSRAYDLQASLLLAAVGASTIGVLFYNIMPLYLGSLQDSSGFDNSQIGLVASAFFLGFNLISASSYFWIRKLPARACSMVSVLLLCLMLVADASVESFLLVIITSVIIGGTSGALATIGTTIIGDSQNSTQWYSVKVALEAVAALILLFVLPVTLIPLYGFVGTVVGMVLMILLILPSFLFLSKWQPRVENIVTVSSQSTSPVLQSTTRVWAILLATLVYFIGAAAIWAFEERIAKQYEIDPSWVGVVLGVSLVCGVAGSVIAGGVGERFGNRTPFTLATCLMIIGAFSMNNAHVFVEFYAVGAWLFMMGWGAGLPFLYSLVAKADTNGRHIALMTPALGLGTMIGTGLAGFLYSGGTLTPLLTMAVSAIAVSIPLIWVACAGTVSR